MNIFILIIMIAGSYPSNPVAITSVEFSSQLKCEQALKTVTKEDITASKSAYCVEK